MKGKNSCYHHGGASPSGAGNGNFRHGRYSKVLPRGIAEDYEAALENAAYLELREEVALMDSLITDALLRSNVGETGRMWEELGEVWTRFQEAQPAKDMTTAGRCLRRMGQIIEEGAASYASRTEAVGLVDQRRRLVETDRKRQVDMQQMVSAQQALALVAAVVAAVRKHVAGAAGLTHAAEREILAGISADVSRLIHQDVSGAGGGVLSTFRD